MSASWYSELVSILDFPSPLQHRGICDHRIPSQEIANLSARLGVLQGTSVTRWRESTKTGRLSPVGSAELESTKAGAIMGLLARQVAALAAEKGLATQSPSHGSFITFLG
jgi:hypothetical protein